MGMFDLTGRIALVTGSSQGIGLALARGLAQAGAEVIVNGRDPGRVGAAVAALRAEGMHAHGAPFDVTDRAAVASAVAAIEADVGPVRILVNNAGIQVRAPLHDFPPEAFDRLFAVNVTAVFDVSQAVARHMIARGEGKIVNVASVNAALARPTIAPYTATKGAVANLTKGMAADWARLGLNCNAIAPGYVQTPLNAALMADPEFNLWLLKRTPQGRWGRVEELAGACVFLASDAASFVNGHVLYVDGGITVSL
jgi:gluconate 5-dehydrogenase